MALTEAQKARGKKHYAAHRDAKIAAVMARLAKRAEDPVLAEEDRQSLAARKARYSLRHPERVLASIAKWTAAHPDEINAARRARYAEDPTKPLANSRKRHALRKGATHSDLTDAQWQAIKAAYGFRCVYCPPTCWRCRQKKHALTQDHLTPLSAGGPDTLWNVVPACRSCNARKGTGPVLVPTQPLLIL